jgi:hypothetical protein
MYRVGFEPTTPVFEWAKTVHVSDCAATMIGVYSLRSRRDIQLAEQKYRFVDCLDIKSASQVFV